MLTFIDISSHQQGIDLPTVLGNVSACVAKATEGTGYVNPYCDKWVQQCISAGKPWGFYHFAGTKGATAEADYFYKNCLNYFKHGVPILDWEGNQSVAWVNEFVARIHELTGVWCWIYANPWRFNQGGVEPNCMRWVASYPNVKHPTFEQVKGWETPKADGLVGAWQFCSDGRVDGYSGNLDCSLFYGDESAWMKYAGVEESTPAESEPEPDVEFLENEDYKVTIERKS